MERPVLQVMCFRGESASLLNASMFIDISVLSVEYLVERMSDLLPSLERTVEGYNSYLNDKKGTVGSRCGIGVPGKPSFTACMVLEQVETRSPGIKLEALFSQDRELFL